MTDIRSLTSGEVAGSGLFDELMRTVKAHTLEELTLGRITPENYATVYLGSLTQVLQVSTEYVLKLDQVNQQTLLLKEQVLQAKKQNELMELQKAQGIIANATAQFNLDTMLPIQKLQTEAQTALIVEQRLQAIAQTAMVGEQRTQIVTQTSLVTKQEDLVDQQIIDAEDKLKSVPVGALNLAAYNKTVAEAGILGQRKVTETAQTAGTITDNNGVLTNSVGGLLGKQMELIYTQRQGFVRDAEQKVAKIHADAFNVAHSLTPNANLPSYYGLGRQSAAVVMDKLAAGINVAIPSGAVTTPT